MTEFNRRTLLFTCVAGGAAIAVASNTALGSSKPREADPQSTVKTFGAVSDGITDDSAAFLRAVNAGETIRIPAGEYRIDSALALRTGQSVIFEPGVVIRAGAYMDAAIFDANGADNVNILGNGALIDLNQKTDRAIRIQGTASRKARRCVVSGISVVGRAVTSDPETAVAAIELTHLDGVTASNIQVDGYANMNAKGTEQGYSLGLFYCVDPKVQDLRVTNGNVGLEIYQCVDVQASNFTIRKCTDNGIYILAGSTAVYLSGGSIDDCEEGVVIRSDNVTLSNIKITNCTNKGVTLRTGQRGKIEACHFEGNNVHIGDDREGDPTTNLSLRNSSFLNAREQAISLIATSDADFIGLDLRDSTATYTGGLIRLANARQCTIRNSRFDNPGKSAPVMVRISQESANVIISDNVFVEADIAIDLFRASGAHPEDTQILDNTFLSVNTPVRQSDVVTGTVERHSR